MKKACLVLIVCMLMASVVLPVAVAVEIISDPADTTPPILAGFSFDPTTIDVSAGPQDLTFTLRITDELSGVASAVLSLTSPSGKQSRSGVISQYNRISGDELDGVYKAKVSFAQSSEAGTWHIRYLVIADKVGNSRWYYETGLIAMGFPTQVKIVGGLDLAPPVLAGFSFSPATIDVSTGPEDLTFTLRITDELSGVASAVLSLTSPSGKQSRSGVVSQYNRVSGDALDGVYMAKVTSPQYSEAGMWHVRYLVVTDKVGNSRWYYEADLTAIGFATKIEVISVPTDTTPPLLAGLSFSPTTIDVSAGPQDLTFTLRITDELSGVASAVLSLTSPSGKQSRSGVVSQYNRISGDALDGIYNAKVTFPQYSEAGTWRIRYVVVTDRVGNSRWYYETDLIAMGFTTEIEISDSISPPTPSLLLPTDGVCTIDNTPTFDWTDVTDPSTPVTYDLIVDNNEDLLSPEISQTGLTASTFTAATALADGRYSWKARARDGVGNIGPFSTVYTFTVDTVPPTSSAGSLSPFQTSPTFEVPYTASDPSPGSGVASVQLWYRVGTSGPYILYGTFTSVPISFTAASQGLYQFYTMATDNAGNVESAPSSPDAETLVEIDRPTTLIALSGTPGGHGWYISDVKVTLTATDTGGSGVKEIHHIINAVGTVVPGSTAEFTLSTDGISELEYWAVDNAGNEENPHSTAQVEIDKTKPVITISSPEPRDYLQTESITLHFGSTDPAPGSGIDMVTADLDGKPVVDGQVIDLMTLPSGSHTLTVAAVDVAGNSASASVTFNVRSAENPRQDERAKNLKQDAIPELEVAKGLCDKESAKKIDEVIKHVQNSLGSDLWVSGMRLDPKHGQKVFEEEKEAVKKIQELLKHKDLPAGLKPVLEKVIHNLVAADKMLVEAALNDAKAMPNPDKKVEHEIGESEREVAKAAGELAEGHPDEAIESYKHAWEHAQNALKH